MLISLLNNLFTTDLAIADLRSLINNMCRGNSKSTQKLNIKGQNTIQKDSDECYSNNL